MQEVWNKIDTLTKKIYKCYMEIKEMDVNDELNEEISLNYDFCLKTMFEMESKLYDKLDVQEIEYLLNSVFEMGETTLYNIDVAQSEALKELEFDVTSNIIKKYKYNRLNKEYIKRTNKQYEQYPNEKVSNDGKFFMDKKNIYVYNRVAEFDYIKSSALSVLSYNFIKVFDEIKSKSPEFDELFYLIKYNLLFLEPNLSSYFLAGKDISFNGEVNNELFDYFIEYYATDQFREYINTLLDYSYEELIGEFENDELFVFKLFEINLRSVSLYTKEEIINDTYIQLDKLNNAYDTFVISEILNIIDIKNSKQEEKREKIKK